MKSTSKRASRPSGPIALTKSWRKSAKKTETSSQTLMAKSYKPTTTINTSSRAQLKTKTSTASTQRTATSCSRKTRISRCRATRDLKSFHLSTCKTCQNTSHLAMKRKMKAKSKLISHHKQIRTQKRPMKMTCSSNRGSRCPRKTTGSRFSTSKTFTRSIRSSPKT